MSLMIRLDNELDWKQSRSKWVKSAILQKLEGSFDFNSIHSKQLLGMLHYRKIITTELLTSLLTRVEETVEEQ